MIDCSEMVSFILKKTEDNVKKFGDKCPCSVVNGKYEFASTNDWRLGFWGGILNYCYELSGEKIFFEGAKRQNEILRDRLYNHPETLDHDIGFLYAPTIFAEYKITGNKECLNTARDAADILIKRYNAKGKFIQAWDEWPFEKDFSKNNPRRMIIDCMFNLPLLFEISKETGDDKYAVVAESHADTCSRTIVREDGTTFHTYLFNPETGEPDRGETWQGYADDSCWSRGQAWAAGGFTMAYRYTKNEQFLKTAIKTSDKFIELLEGNYLPAWDFVFKGRNAALDASAAGIAACGLLELSEYVDKEKGAFYHDAAEKIVNALWTLCSSKNDDDYEALIKRCTGFFAKNSEVDTGIIYGDYYFVKAVVKLAGKKWFV